MSDYVFGFALAGAGIGFGVTCSIWGITHNSVGPSGIGGLLIVVGLYLWVSLRQERQR